MTGTNKRHPIVPPSPHADHPFRTLALAVAWALLSAQSIDAADGPETVYKTRLNASDPSMWKPVPYQAVSPTGGVTLDDHGIFKPVMDNNINYLLNSFSVNHLLVPFRERAGQKNPPDDRKQVGFWDTDLRGSSAGRFLMGAGNTLRWFEHPELRRRLNELIDGIEACREPNGYILAYPPDKTRSEEPNYGRAWFTHGLIEAAIAGNPKAYGLLRGHADWFNHWDMLPKLIYHSGNSHQGHIASTRTYFSPVGKPEDLQVAEKYYVQDWWMDQLAARRAEAVYKYPLPTPHSYLITSFEAYLDHYRATGDTKYLDSMRGAWAMIHDQWEHIGGSMAICEAGPGAFPPGSYFVTAKGHTGETCGSVFWIKFCQRFHQLYPTEETYANEIEKSIYNVCLPAQVGGRGIKYHARLEGVSDNPTDINTCCEGQGTRLLGSLPEYIYSIAQDGLYVNLYEPSSLRWNLAGQTVSLTLKSQFPFRPDVALKLTLSQPAAMKLRVRVPAWASKDMPITINGQQAAVGKPGSYAVLDRIWAEGDTVTFTLPMDIRVTRYSGADKIAGHERYALEYGPILLAAVGPLGKKIPVQIAQDPDRPQDWLKSTPDPPLHFAIAGDTRYSFMPYWQISTQTFSCFPVIDPVAIRGAELFLKSTSVEMLCGVPQAEIRYTQDGAQPSAQSTLYTSPFPLERTTTVTARPFSQGQPVATTVAVAFQKVALFPPTIRPAADGKTIEMLVPPPFPQARIHYTLDGSEPTETSPRYGGPIAMPADATRIRARSIVPGEAQSTPVFFHAATSAQNPWPQPDVHLSDLQALKATVGWKTVQKDRSIDEKPLTFLGREYKKGMGVHAVSELVYPIQSDYRRFVALAGIDDSTQNRGSVIFEVYLDDQLVAQTPVLRSKQAWHFDIPLPPSAKQLRLVLTDGGDDYNYDWGDWLNAGFVLK